MAKLIFGCGYLGLRVARLWTQEGKKVMAVTRSADRSLTLAKEGLFTIEADVTNPESLESLRGLSHFEPVDTVLFAIGFDRTAGQSIDDVYAGGLRNMLATLPESVNRVIYISTTGVYGDAAGDWIDEQTPPAPRREGGQAALAVEQALTAHPLGKNAVILRLAGLYGPGRIPFLDKLRAAEAIPAEREGHLNLIHVDDAARIVAGGGELTRFADGPRIYCVSDGNPVVRGDYYREVARQIGAPAPRFVAPDPTTHRAARAEADRRVRNTRILNELNISLVYPDYRAGLAAILE